MISAGVSTAQSGAWIVLWKSTLVMKAPGGQVRLYEDPLVTLTPIGGRMSTDWHASAAWHQAQCTSSVRTTTLPFMKIVLTRPSGAQQNANLHVPLGPGYAQYATRMCRRTSDVATALLATILAKVL
jgi:hypothetical protein